MEEAQKETWDPKKILIALVLLAVLAVVFKTFVLGENSKVMQKSVSVEGTSTSQSPLPTPAVSEEIRKSVEVKLNDLKREVNNINVVEVATSTPAVQKVLNDLKNLQSLPQSQAKDACFKICNGL